MTRIRIKNFGPIKEGFAENGGWIDVKKVTVFIGNQGSGKSTVAKLISTLLWMEKALYRGDIEKEKITEKIFRSEYIGYQGIQSYFSGGTEIEFTGEAFRIKYSDGNLTIDPVQNHYLLPKIMYAPAERNFLTTLKNPEKINDLPKPLYTFLSEYDRSLNELNGSVRLPINDTKLWFSKVSKTPYLRGKNYRIRLREGSSGFQSMAPLFIVSRNLSRSIGNKKDPSRMSLSLEQASRKKADLERIERNPDLSESEKNQQILAVTSRYEARRFVNIVEEPEQNLFPSSQRALLNSILAFNNRTAGNVLIITTHSPYLINDITICIEAYSLLEEIKEAHKMSMLDAKVGAIVPLESVINPQDAAIYELNEMDGTIQLLNNYEGLPSDEHKLNEQLGEGNELFAQLLEIRQILKYDNANKD